MVLPKEIINMSFLVTDDYETMRLMLGEQLRKLGITKIKFAVSGNEALDTLNKSYDTPERIDFLLTDLVMENGTGLDLVKGARAQERFKKLPILMITSKSEIALVLECVKAGVNNYIVKPWKEEDLAKKIIDTQNKVK